MKIDFNPVRGARHYCARFTDETALAIRLRWARGERQTDLAREYGVSIDAVSKLVRGKTWKHLPTPIRIS
jgi:hypothetical protein